MHHFAINDVLKATRNKCYNVTDDGKLSRLEMPMINSNEENSDEETNRDLVTPATLTNHPDEYSMDIGVHLRLADMEYI